MMFGAVSSTRWTVTYTRFKKTYYLVEHDEVAKTQVWTLRKDKAKGFTSMVDAMTCAETIKQNHINKKSTIEVVQG